MGPVPNIFPILVYFVLVVIAAVRCDNLIVPINDHVTVEQTDNDVYVVSMDENNHDFDDINKPHTPLFGIVGANTLQRAISFIQGPFTYSIEEDSDTESFYIFYADQSFDYETQPHSYSFNIFINDEAPAIMLSINNIDDEPPTLSAPQCSFEENTIYTSANSTCFSVVSDPDGWLDQMTFEIANNGHDESLVFALEYREQPADTVYSANVYITVLEELNYQNISIYLFDIKAQDGAGHSTTPNELVAAIITVIDLPDTPPEWTNYFTCQQFEEQSEHVFAVTAIDGDYGLNYEINYMKLWEDDEEANYISIDNNGTIKVNKIDRDKNDISTYNFAIMAYEVPNAPLWNNTLTITFYIMDIDNNPPLINWILDNSNINRTFDDVPEKSTEMGFLENYSGNLNLTIFISDIDTGENARFSVELEDLEENEIAYTEAFFIAPTAGYRSDVFQISVRNATYLDYEVPEWVHISFNVLTKGLLDQQKTDRLLVNITLIDYNDEWPIFPETEYSVDINAAAKKGDFIIQVLATDRDAEDAILKHTLIGSSYTNRVLAIESDTGNIYVNADNAFDYDTINPVFVQVKATDKANHTATVLLTINIFESDINKHAPIISVGDPISVDEDQQSSVVLNSSIRASDVDATANLSAEIDWDSSYAMKNSRRLDMTNERTAQQVKFLNVRYYRMDSDDDTNTDIVIDLIVNDNNPDGTTPDFELFDSLYLSLVVTDWNTDPEFLNNQNTSAIILVSINDLNDNTPYFPEGNLPESERENRTVQENAPQGTSVSSIVAIDLDVDDILTYSCIPVDPKFDWIDVNTETGAFTVKDSNVIDADTHKTYYFNYSCTASDNGNTHTSDPLIVPFYIIDTNNKVPTITINDIVFVYEKSAPLTDVSDIQTEDLDRDIPFHTVECTLDRDTTCAEKFIIISNVVTVRNGGNDIDRDLGDKNYTCSMTCQDNPDRLQNDQNPHSVISTFVISLNDINDHAPEILTKSINTTENAIEGSVVGTILAMDIDEGPNAEIDFKILSVENSSGEEVTGLFDIATDDSYYVNSTHKQTKLVALKDLSGAYGTYVVTIQAKDEGNPPLVTSSSITVQVDKFNLESPRFVVPNTDDANFLLLSSQKLYSPLLLYRSEDSEYLTDFYACVNSENDTCSKWDVNIDFEQTSPDDEETIFTIVKTDPCKGQLQVNDHFNPVSVIGKTYKLTLYATIKEGEPQDGEAPYKTETHIKINFIYNNYI